MNILILGNGFDIAHGLDTRYTDFLNYCQAQFYKLPGYKPSNCYFTNMWLRHFLNIANKIGNNWIDLETEIHKVIHFIAKTAPFDTQGCYGLFNLNFDDANFNFYNIENYLSKQFAGLGVDKKEYVRLDEHNWIEYKIYFASLNGFINFLYDQLRDFALLFKNYLKNEVLKPMPLDSQYKLSLKTKNKNVYVLSFNYTNTCVKLYDNNANADSDFKIKPVYVHGNITNNNKCNLVFGTQTFEINPSKIPLPTHFNIFQKHYQRHKYQTIEPYQELIRQIKKSRSIPKFHIIGHSLDETDHKILKHILQAKDDCIINIYFHNEEMQKILMDRINDIIGENEVMSKVRFIHQHEDERSILKPKNQTT